MSKVWQNSEQRVAYVASKVVWETVILYIQSNLPIDGLEYLAINNRDGLERLIKEYDTNS